MAKTKQRYVFNLDDFSIGGFSHLRHEVTINLVPEDTGIAALDGRVCQLELSLDDARNLADYLNSTLDGYNA